MWLLSAHRDCYFLALEILLLTYFHACNESSVKQLKNASLKHENEVKLMAVSLELPWSSESTTVRLSIIGDQSCSETSLSAPSSRLDVSSKPLSAFPSPPRPGRVTRSRSWLQTQKQQRKVIQKVQICCDNSLRHVSFAIPLWGRGQGH